MKINNIRQWSRRLSVKVAAVFLAVVLLLTGAGLVAGSLIVAWFGGADDGFGGTPEGAQKNAAEMMLTYYAKQNFHRFASGNADALAELYGDAPFDYTVTWGTEVLIDTAPGGEVFAEGSIQDDRLTEDGNIYTVVVRLSMTPEAVRTGRGWIPYIVRTVGRWYAVWGVLFALGLLCWIGALAVLIGLLSVAGWHEGEPAPRCGALERIPFDLFTVLTLAAGYILFGVFEGFFYAPWLILCLMTVWFAVSLLLLVIGYTVSLAVRIKTHTLWRHTLIGYAVRFALRVCRAVWTRLPLLWRTLALLGGVTVAEILLLSLWGSDDLPAVWLIGKVLLFAPILWTVLGLCRLQEGARRMAAGQMEYTIPTRSLPPAVKQSAEDLNHIRDGMAGAVEAKLKSERLRTELITNVSHDLKTPLTSLINYVDLLQKEESAAAPDREKTQEYLAVLERQSAKLKKLVEDLVEASKASTGNLRVEPAPCTLGVLLEQTVGEYTEKAAAAGLELVLTLPPRTVTVTADGRHLWRVLDNLMNNICKYALRGTRVYLDLTAGAEWAVITFRNVSAEALHCDGAELTERFVRGDGSRHTEGSGLGLSIARSLTELQGGHLTVTADGDLFKVTVRLPVAPETPAE